MLSAWLPQGNGNSLHNNRRNKCTAAEIKTRRCFHPKPNIWSNSTEYAHAAFICCAGYARPSRGQTRNDMFQDTSSSTSDVRLCMLCANIVSLMVPLRPAGEKGTVSFDIWRPTHAVSCQQRINLRAAFPPACAMI